MNKRSTNVKCLLLSAAAGLLTIPTLALAQDAELVVSAIRGDRLKEQPVVSFVTNRGAKADFVINEKTTDQTIIGFGASFQEAGMIAINDLSPSKQDEVLRMMFDPEQGVGFSAMITYIHATDMQAAGPYFTYADTPGDYRFDHFSIERDLRPTGTATFIQRARKYGDFTLAARMDYPPNWLLTSMQMTPMNQLPPKHYPYVSKYLLKYLEEYRKIGIDIDYLSPFNEPGNYTKISFLEIGNFIRDHLGPDLQKSGFDTKIQFADASQRRLAIAAYPPILKDPAVAKYIAGLTYHNYDYARVENRDDSEAVAGIAQLHKDFPNVHLWMSETCYHDGGWPTDPLHRSWIRQIPVFGFDDGDFWGQQIFSELEAGASAWTYWNLLLDQGGGPSLPSPLHSYPPINRQQAVVHVDRDRDEILYPGVFYYLGHFAKFVRPGSVRVATTGTAKDVRVLTFRRPDGKLVAQVMNSSFEPRTSSLGWNGRTLTLDLPARSISSYVWDKSDATQK